MRGLEDQPAKRFPSMAALIAELTPPPVRAPRRMVAAIGVAVLAMGAAGAAVLSRGRDELPVAKEQQFRQRIQELEAERDALVQRAIADGSLREEMRKAIQKKDQQIQELLAAEAPPAADMEFPPVVVAKRPAKPPPDVGLAVVNGLRASAGILTGCFAEWSERYPDRAAELTVRMTVAPNGSRHTVDAVGVDDSALPICVADAVKSVPVPAPGVVLRLAIDVSYAGGAIAIEPHVVGVDPDTGPIDLGKTGARPGLIDLDP
jgi:hypothetical protein